MRSIRKIYIQDEYNYLIAQSQDCVIVKGSCMENYNQELDQIKRFLRGTSKGLTVTEIAHHIQVNRNSVAKYLDILRTSGLVEMKAVGSAKIYSTHQTHSGQLDSQPFL